MDFFHKLLIGQLLKQHDEKGSKEKQSELGDQVAL